MQFGQMEPTILRSEALKQIDTGEPCDLVFVTADRKRGTGGELVSVKGWQKMVGEPATTSKPGQVRRNKQVQLSKDPNHQKNKTINIHNPLSRNIHPITVHIALIQFFNGKRILNG